jgi:amidase
MTPLGTELASLDGIAQAELVKAGELSPRDLVTGAIERVEALNPQINAVTIPLFEKALTAADRDPGQGSSQPFGGVPIVIKDNAAAAGEPRYRGMRLLRDLGWIENHDSFAVARLRQAGFISIGRANLPELAGGITTEPLAHGPCRNPWNVEHSVGGSSGGSAAAVAAGLVPVAHGTDGGGSVRIPASLCGVVGLKPSRGRISMGPEFTDTEGLSTASVLTRSVRDTAAAIDSIAGSVAGDPWTAPPLRGSLLDAVARDPAPLRIGVWTPSGDPSSSVHPDCSAACEAVADLLVSLGHKVEASHPKELTAAVTPSFFAVATALIAWEVADISRYTDRQITEADVEPVVWKAVEAGRQVSAVAYQDAIAEIRSTSRRFAAWWDEGWDLLLSPTVAQPPWPLGAVSPPTPEDPWPDVRPWIPFTPQFNLSGLPAISLPLHWSTAGLPIGVQLGARLGREDQLLAVAGQLERARPWSHRWPACSISALSRPGTA